jgi:hypothetical protein
LFYQYLKPSFYQTRFLGNYQEGITSRM